MQHKGVFDCIFFFPLHRVTHNGLIHARHCLTGHLKRCPPLQNSPSPPPEAKNVPKVFHTREFDRLTLRASSVSFVYRSFTERTGPRKRTSPPCFSLSGAKKGSFLFLLPFRCSHTIMRREAQECERDGDGCRNARLFSPCKTGCSFLTQIGGSQQCRPV